MKELTIEEKAKAYDEALEKARLVLQERGNEPDGAALLSKLFPHLRESDDERIKKELLEHIKYCSESIPERAAYIAWLEKQGEHANFCNKIQIGDKVTRNRDGVLVNLSQLNRVAKKDEKQGEQKPTIIIPRFRVGDEIKTTNEAPLTITKITDSGYWSEDLFICSFENSTKWELVEQNPAWSEEDEELRLACIRNFEQQSPLPTSIYTDCIKWLKSLKPHNRWKPSEEQMDALLWVIENSHKSIDVNAQLNLLYEQLKALLL